MLRAFCLKLEINGFGCYVAKIEEAQWQSTGGSGVLLIVRCGLQNLWFLYALLGYMFPETKLEFDDIGCVSICNPLLAIVQIILTNCKSGNSEPVHNSLCLL